VIEAVPIGIGQIGDGGGPRYRVQINLTRRFHPDEFIINLLSLGSDFSVTGRVETFELLAGQVKGKIFFVIFQLEESSEKRCSICKIKTIRVSSSSNQQFIGEEIFAKKIDFEKKSTWNQQLPN
jgi:hypothetical protein